MKPILKTQGRFYIMLGCGNAGEMLNEVLISSRKMISGCNPTKCPCPGF